MAQQVLLTNISKLAGGILRESKESNRGLSKLRINIKSISRVTIDELSNTRTTSNPVLQNISTKSLPTWWNLNGRQVDCWMELTRISWLCGPSTINQEGFYATCERTSQGWQYGWQWCMLECFQQMRPHANKVEEDV